MAQKLTETGIEPVLDDIAPGRVNLAATFFADPAAAFANIGRAMRPGARLVLMVWQSQKRNEWVTPIQRALAPGTVASPSADAAFSLSDPAIATGILTTLLRSALPRCTSRCSMALASMRHTML